MSHIEKRGLIFFLFCTGVTLSVHLPHVDVINIAGVTRNCLSLLFFLLKVKW